MAEPMTRLLRCDDCRTVEALPDYEGDVTGDHFLAQLTAPHQHPDGMPHQGALMRVESRHWSSPSTRTALLQRIQETAGHTGLDFEFYATKSTYEDDALRCFAKHHRNPHCNEYKAYAKRLTPGTQAERKAAGLPKYDPPVHRYLCEFCPVHSLVITNARYKAGYYH